MLFDMLSTIEATGSAAIVAAVLSFALSQTADGRFRAALALTAWFLIVVTLGATEALQAEHGSGVPGLGAAVMLPIVALCFAFFVVPTTREAISAIPLPILIAVNMVRLLGFSFLLLYAAHRLPGPFAPVAGWGDIFVGATAGPIAWIAMRNGARAKNWVLVWNLIGFVDLIAAVGLGATSTPGPLRLLMEPPGSGIMTTLPWIIIPCFLVPSFEAIHVAIFYRLSRNAGGESARMERMASAAT
jgi:hypothetical protein